jgi:DNA transposition AAA+ family ATPase
VKKNQTLPSRNFLLGNESVERMLALGPDPSDSSRIVVVDGPAGTGKTTIAKSLAKKYRGVYYSVAELETAHTLLGGIDEAVNGFTVSAYGQRLWLGRLIEDLERRHWPLIVLDEADRLDRVRHGVSLLEVIRDLHDRSQSIIILLSISHLARRLANPVGGYQEAFSSRVAMRIRFERCVLEDVQLFAQRLLEDVTLDMDLMQHCVEASAGSYRPLIALLSEIEKTAKTAGIRTVSLAKWRQLASFAGLPAGAEAPRRQNAKQPAKGAAA